MRVNQWQHKPGGDCEIQFWQKGLSDIKLLDWVEKLAFERDDRRIPEMDGPMQWDSVKKVSTERPDTERIGSDNATWTQPFCLNERTLRWEFSEPGVLGWCMEVCTRATVTLFIVSYKHRVFSEYKDGTFVEKYKAGFGKLFSAWLENDCSDSMGGYLMKDARIYLSVLNNKRSGIHCPAGSRVLSAAFSDVLAI